MVKVWSAVLLQRRGGAVSKDGSATEFGRTTESYVVIMLSLFQGYWDLEVCVHCKQTLIFPANAVCSGSFYHTISSLFTKACTELVI